MGLMIPDYNTENIADIRESLRRETKLGEYLGAQSGLAFERTTSNVIIDEFSIAAEERKKYGAAAVAEPKDTSDYFLYPMGQEEEQKAVPRLTKEEYENSEWFRKGVEWNENMTDVRAAYIAKEYDDREYRKHLVENSPSGLRSVLGFGASMLGGLPDPINLIPFGAGTASIGKTVGRTFLETAAAGAAGAAVTDIVALPYLESQGEDIGFSDWAMDIIGAGILGGGLGVGGKKLGEAVTNFRKRGNYKDRQLAGNALEDAVLSVVEGKPVDVSKIYEGKAHKLNAIIPEDAIEGKVDFRTAPEESNAILSHRQEVNNTITEIQTRRKDIEAGKVFDSEEAVVDDIARAIDIDNEEPILVLREVTDEKGNVSTKEVDIREEINKEVESELSSEMKAYETAVNCLKNII